MSTQTVTTTTCDSCGRVKPDHGEQFVDASWAHLLLSTNARIATVDACSTDCGGNLTAALMRGEIGEPTTRVAVGDSVAAEVEVKPVLPVRLTNRCPIGATSSAQCWDELPKNAECQKHGTPRGRE